MKDTTPPPENSNISNSESMSDQKKTSITKMSDESREFRELNKEILAMEVTIIITRMVLSLLLI